MRTLLCFFCLQAILYYELSFAQEESQLLGVVLTFRHGDRTPLQSYPNDPYNNYFKLGKGQLTNPGKKRQFELGKWLRNRYNGFLPEQYSNKDLFVASDDVDRTLMSAQSNLAGLYPPINDQVWNQNLLWQPIPVHPVPKAIIGEIETCLKFDALYAEVFLSEYFFQINEENKELYKFLSNETGEWVFSIVQVKQIRDILYIEDTLGLELPEWTKGVYPEKINPLSALIFYAMSYNEAIARLSSGPFIYNMLEKFEGILANSSEVPKFYMYSGHDNNVASFLHALIGPGLEPFSPNFASCLIFELRERNDQQFINILLKDGDDVIQKFNLPNCDFDCELGKFKEIVSNIIISSEEWDKECLFL